MQGFPASVVSGSIQMDYIVIFRGSHRGTISTTIAKQIDKNMEHEADTGNIHIRSGLGDVGFTLRVSGLEFGFWAKGFRASGFGFRV